MHVRYALVSVLLGMTGISSTGCETKNPASPGPLGSAEALVRALQNQNAAVSVMEEMPRDSYPFSVAARRLSVNGENVYVFTYADAAAADRDAAMISPDGSGIGTSMITWMGPPRFYKKDHLVVLYVGANPEVTRPLEAVLGKPIAGR